MTRNGRRTICCEDTVALFLFMLGLSQYSAGKSDILLDNANGDQWPGYGRTYSNTHFSPLSEIDASNVSNLGLAWWFDIPGVVLATSVPLEVDGTLYFATGYSVVRAVDAISGRILWTYDPEVSTLAGRKLRLSWGIRGIAYWNNRVYVGTHDGRLIALNAKNGKLSWNVQTTEPDDLRFINGPPLAFKDTVVIGHGGSDASPLRGYVTAYDADTGKQLWRFFTVPGDPSNGFENDAMKMAAQTWSGRWWEKFGGGTVWNAMTYDPKFDRVYIGTSNGLPWNHAIRSPGGDNLFLASIIALDAKTGAYRWHYQTNPGETWDFDADTDLELTRIQVNGKMTDVLIHASKNGFFYVIDRATGKLISAQNFARVTWAKGVSVKTGRPVEIADARYEDGQRTVWPGPIGAHGPQAMAFNPGTALAYIPTIDLPFDYKGIDPSKWQPTRELVPNFGLDFNIDHATSPSSSTPRGWLMAWDPARQRASWRIELPGLWNGGVATTAGNLVFQGRYDGKFVAYSADAGKELWAFDAQVGIVGAPITYSIAGHQYVTVMAGFGGTGSALGSRWDARTQPRRVLCFALGGTRQLPPAPPPHRTLPTPDPEFRHDTTSERSGAATFGYRCAGCHGPAAIAGGSAPDLRESPIILSALGFSNVVKNGGLVKEGMPRFEELSDAEVESLRSYVRSRAQDLRDIAAKDNIAQH